jgi:chromosome segregation ATPase
MTRRRAELEEAIKLLEKSEQALNVKIQNAEKRLLDLKKQEGKELEDKELITIAKRKVEEELLTLKKEKAEYLQKQTAAQSIVEKELERKVELNEQKLSEAHENIKVQKEQLAKLSNELELAKAEVEEAQSKVHETTLELYKAQKQVKATTDALNLAGDMLKEKEAELEKVKNQLKDTEAELAEANEMKEVKKFLKTIQALTYHAKWRSEKWREAENRIAEFRKQYPNNERLIEAQAMCYIHLEDKEAAKKILEDHKEDNPYVLKRLGRVYQSSGDYMKAVECFLAANQSYHKRYGVEGEGVFFVLILMDTL